MANQMFLKPEYTYEGFSLIDIRRYATMPSDDQAMWKAKKKEVSLWNKFSKIIHKYNPEISSRWDEICTNYDSENHIKVFIDLIFAEVKEGDINLEDIRKIGIEENGSRGLGSTMDMLLYNEKNKVIFLKTCYMDKFYFM